MKHSVTFIAIFLTVVLFICADSIFAQNNPDNFPLFEGFEGLSTPQGLYGAIPLGWYKKEIGYDTYILQRQPAPTVYLPDNYAMRFYQGTAGGYEGYCLYTPLISLLSINPNSSVVLRFSLRADIQGHWECGFRVFIPDDYLDWGDGFYQSGVVLANVDIPMIWTTVEIDITDYIGEEIRLAFHSTHIRISYEPPPSENISTIWLDNISIQITPDNPYVISSFPYYESFEQNEAPAPEWAFIGQGITSSWEHFAFTTDDPQYRYLARTGNYNLGSQFPSTPDDASILVSPKFKMPEDIDAPIYLNYYVRCLLDIASEEQYTVLVSTTDTEPDSFVEIFNETLTVQTDDWHKRTLNISEYQGQDIYIALKHTAGSVSNYILIDDFYIGKIPQVYLPPRNLIAEVLNNNVVLAWNEPEEGSTATLTGYMISRDGEIICDHTPAFEYNDSDVADGMLYQYTVYARYSHPNGMSEPISTDIETHLSDNDSVMSVSKNMLYSNYPNPFNPSTTILFDIARDTHVSIEIFNIKGQKVKEMVSGSYSAGRHSVVWNGDDTAGRAVGSGVYFYRMTTDGYSSVRNMLLLK